MNVQLFCKFLKTYGKKVETSTQTVHRRSGLIAIALNTLFFN